MKIGIFYPFLTFWHFLKDFDILDKHILLLQTKRVIEELGKIKEKCTLACAHHLADHKTFG